MCYTVFPCTGAMNESCWFTVHPASNQRSEGEKVWVDHQVVSMKLGNTCCMCCMIVASLWPSQYVVVLSPVGQSWWWYISCERGKWKISGGCLFWSLPANLSMSHSSSFLYAVSPACLLPKCWEWLHLHIQGGSSSFSFTHCVCQW